MTGNRKNITSSCLRSGRTYTPRISPADRIGGHFANREKLREGDVTYVSRGRGGPGAAAASRLLARPCNRAAGSGSWPWPRLPGPSRPLPSLPPVVPGRLPGRLTWWPAHLVAVAGSPGGPPWPSPWPSPATAPPWPLVGRGAVALARPALAGPGPPTARPGLGSARKKSPRPRAVEPTGGGGSNRGDTRPQRWRQRRRPGRRWRSIHARPPRPDHASRPPSRDWRRPTRTPPGLWQAGR